jgi:phage FluMu protein Com
MPMQNAAEDFIEVRCIACHKILFEAAAETSGVVRKKCDRCKTFRTVRLPLQSTAKRYNIPVDAAKAA